MQLDVFNVLEVACSLPLAKLNQATVGEHTLAIGVVGHNRPILVRLVVEHVEARRTTFLVLSKGGFHSLLPHTSGAEEFDTSDDCCRWLSASCEDDFDKLFSFFFYFLIINLYGQAMESPGTVAQGEG